MEYGFSPNRFPGRCTCGAYVEAGAGKAERIGVAWKVFCASCPTPKNLRAVRHDEDAAINDPETAFVDLPEGRLAVSELTLSQCLPLIRRLLRDLAQSRRNEAFLINKQSPR